MHRRPRPRQEPHIVRRLFGDDLPYGLADGSLVVGRQTRRVQAGDVVLVTWHEAESLRRVIHPQGDLLYLVEDERTGRQEWLPAKAIAAKVVWPSLLADYSGFDTPEAEGAEADEDDDRDQ